MLINNVDNLFYERTLSSRYHDILKSFYDRDEDINSYNLELPRKIFNSFLSYLCSNPKENREIDYFKIIDSIYFKKNPKKSINFDFYDFYKYFYNNFDQYFSEVYNSKYVECTSEIVDKKNEINKHFYKYKKIELDPQLLMKYILHLEKTDANKNLFEEKKKKCYMYQKTKQKIWIY